MNIGSKKPESKINVSLGLAAGDALLPLLKAMDAGEVSVPLPLWQEIRASVVKTIAEVHFGTNERLNTPTNPESDPSLPDPGEGWELCDREHAEQWQEIDGKWYDGRYLGVGPDRYHRRRVVMTEPPSESRKAPVFCCDGSEWFRVWSDHVREMWGVEFTAWCHLLPGETEPPQMLIDWKPTNP